MHPLPRRPCHHPPVPPHTPRIATVAPHLQQERRSYDWFWPCTHKVTHPAVGAGNFALKTSNRCSIKFTPYSDSPYGMPSLRQAAPCRAAPADRPTPSSLLRRDVPPIFVFGRWNRLYDRFLGEKHPNRHTHTHTRRFFQYHKLGKRWQESTRISTRNELVLFATKDLPMFLQFMACACARADYGNDRCDPWKEICIDKIWMRRCCRLSNVRFVYMKFQCRDRLLWYDSKPRNDINRSTFLFFHLLNVPLQNLFYAPVQ